jgi:hypothetical protein
MHACALHFFIIFLISLHTNWWSIKMSVASINKRAA